MLLLRAWIFNHISMPCWYRPNLQLPRRRWRSSVRYLGWKRFDGSGDEFNSSIFIVYRVHKMNAWEAQNNGVWSYLPTQDAGLVTTRTSITCLASGIPNKHFMPPPPLHPGWGVGDPRGCCFWKNASFRSSLIQRCEYLQVVWRVGFKGWRQSCAGFGQKWVLKLRWLFPSGLQGYY